MKVRQLKMSLGGYGSNYLVSQDLAHTLLDAVMTGQMVAAKEEYCNGYVYSASDEPHKFSLELVDVEFDPAVAELHKQNYKTVQENKELVDRNRTLTNQVAACNMNEQALLTANQELRDRLDAIERAMGPQQEKEQVTDPDNGCEAAT